MQILLFLAVKLLRSQRPSDGESLIKFHAVESARSVKAETLLFSVASDYEMASPLFRLLKKFFSFVT